MPGRRSSSQWIGKGCGRIIYKWDRERAERPGKQAGSTGREERDTKSAPDRESERRSGCSVEGDREREEKGQRIKRVGEAARDRREGERNDTKAAAYATD